MSVLHMDPCLSQEQQPPMPTTPFTSAIVAVLALVSSAHAQHRLITQGNDTLSIMDAEGLVEWEMPWGGIHDIHVLENGNVMVQQGASKIVEIDRASKKIIWEYDSSAMNGNEGKPVEVHAFQPLRGGKRIMIAESGPARIIEIDRTGKLLSETKMTVERPHPHTDTRLVRKIGKDRYLVSHEGDGKVREYEEGTGKVVWEYDVPMFNREAKGGHGPESFGDKCFAALRLPNGNTLIATGNGHSVIEVTPEKEIVWKVEQYDLPSIRLAWVTTLEVLPNGNYMIGNCHAGPGQPILIELDPKKMQAVWTLDEYERFGNSVPNSQILDAPGALR